MNIVLNITKRQSGIRKLQAFYLLDDDLAAVEIVAVHLLQCHVDELVGSKLDDAAAARLAGIVSEHLNIRDLTHCRTKGLS